MNHNDERLISLVGCIRGAVIELDGDGHYLNAWVDDESLLAVPLNELIGKTVVEVLGETAGRPLLDRVRRVHATGMPERFEYQLSIRGRESWFMSDFKRVKADDGYTVLLFRHDISEKKEAEEALRLSEERYRLAAEATNDILYDWDLVANRITWGPSMKRVLGHDSPIIERWVLQVHPDDQARLAASFTEILGSTERNWQIGYRARRADGTYAELLDRGFIMRDANGRALRLVGSLADVTQLNRLQTQLVQSDRLAALGTLAAGVGHEINNPLCFVIGNLDLAIESGPFGCTPEARAEEEETRSALVDAR